MGATWPQRTQGSRQPSWPRGAKPLPRREVPESRRYVAARAGLSPATAPPYPGTSSMNATTSVAATSGSLEMAAKSSDGASI